MDAVIALIYNVVQGAGVCWDSRRHGCWNSRLQYVMPGGNHDFTTAEIKVKNAKLAKKRLLSTL